MVQAFGSDQTHYKPPATGHAQPAHIRVGFFNGPFDLAETPIGPIGCKLIINEKANTHKSWDRRGQEGYNIRSALEHYRFLRVVDKQTKAL